MNIRHNPLPVSADFASIYAHAVEVTYPSRTIHVSGQIGAALDGTVPDTFAAQFRLATSNLVNVLAGADFALGDIVKLTFYLVRQSDLECLNELRRELLAVAPAVTVVVVSALAGPEFLVEVEAIATAVR